MQRKAWVECVVDYPLSQNDLILRTKKAVIVDMRNYSDKSYFKGLSSDEIHRLEIRVKVSVNDLDTYQAEDFNFDNRLARHALKALTPFEIKQRFNVKIDEDERHNKRKLKSSIHCQKLTV